MSKERGYDGVLKAKSLNENSLVLFAKSLGLTIGYVSTPCINIDKSSIIEDTNHESSSV